ncbi:delta-cadinene synthase isozyme XC1 [Gossypium australe]|uniref:Delta-cadinene synthase isozyme XC1 n=1 Tax=Gossypium australe TaxID=47621 RepID=A0A5B6WNP6_9ROSI|nr:delta-cadinene synthase isozyme XC1 [Gossypium australe]
MKHEKRILQGHVEDKLLWNLQKCLDEELMYLLRQTKWSYLKDVFIKIEPWLKKLKINERVTWIEVSGVPLHCWNYKTFKRVAELWEKLVSVGENLTKVHNFKKIELLISITQSNMVDELVSMEVGKDIFPIRVRERGLSELKDDSLNCKARWKNNKDSISESGSVVR